MLDAIYNALQSVGYTHPVHPFVVHVPIGMVVAVFLFGLGAWIFKKPVLAQTARHCSMLAVLFLPLAIVAGLMDWQYHYHGSWLTPIIVKMVLAGLLIAALGTAAFRGISKNIEIKRLIPLYFFCFLLVIGLSFFGGELVYGARGTTTPAKHTRAPVASSGSLVEQGADVFAKRCAFCHLTDSRKAKIGPGLQGLYQRKSLPVSKRSVTEENIRRQLTAPVKNMPSFPDLSQKEVRSLIVYIETL
ncbi:hypothetical protein D3OALGA1CA_5579 [Olavius algarvensis associated proteobacterium Delta 3]|nr:hypothetical protein D3OALGB2SA_5407 [Olavius algarvensis associated proteobacterium Delta 3]CAB5168757.1 hypothetical protein D3OALGA1CA_5579 [Olavius algarvensis associated proteobacterium Delta 3]